MMTLEGCQVQPTAKQLSGTRTRELTRRACGGFIPHDEVNNFTYTAKELDDDAM